MDDEFGRGKRSAKKRTFYGDDEDDEKNSSTSEETTDDDDDEGMYMYRHVECGCINHDIFLLFSLKRYFFGVLKYIAAYCYVCVFHIILIYRFFEKT